MEPVDIGGVHIKYLHHCRRQLWLFARGIRPEARSNLVAHGEAVHDTTLARHTPLDLGAVRPDHLDNDGWVHETKSGRIHRHADTAQAVLYCHRIAELGIDVHGAVLHYPLTRRTIRVPYDEAAAEQAHTDITTAIAVIDQPSSPARLDRPRCSGCSFVEYCWNE